MEVERRTRIASGEDLRGSRICESRAKLIGGECPARFWMPVSYDHCCRDTGEVDRCVRYTLMNPVKAGLSATPQAYPWCGPYL